MDTRLYGQFRSEKKNHDCSRLYGLFWPRQRHFFWKSMIFLGYMDFFGRVAAFFLTNKKSQKKPLKSVFFLVYMDFLNLLRVAGFFSFIWTFVYMDKKDRF